MGAWNGVVWKQTSYRKYTWIGNRITDEDMAKLYKMKKATRKHITVMVAEAVNRYLSDSN